MKLIDYSPPSSTPDFIQRVIERVQTWLPFLSTGPKGHEQLVARLQSGLDNRYFLLKNVLLAGSPEPFPYILIGPTGVTVLNARPETGIFRARGESWWELSKASRQYQPAKTNLVRQSQNLAQRLGVFLAQSGGTAPSILPVLVFVNAGVHIESSLPAVRLVLADGVRRLAFDLRQMEEVLPANEIRRITDLLDRAAQPVPTPQLPAKEEDFFGKDLIQPVAKKSTRRAQIPVPQLNLPPVPEKIGLSRKQWIVIALLTLLTMLVLGFLIFYVLLAA